MLVVRYFACVGGALLVLLLVCAAVLPKPSPTEGAVASAADAPAIRIQSERKWPERIVFDTSAPMPAGATVVAQPQGPVPQPALAEAAAKARMREAFAQVPADQSKQVAAEARKPEKPVVKRKVARAHAPSPYAPQYAYAPQYPQYRGGYGYGYGRQPMQVAQQPHFGFFW
ncbi:hypothetical protein [Bradyrhizobium sp. STM 3562]|uniref:hypothetical protein n=1 Tax=Bradyrhizobium sp. STM 3562 TaxID=578924 RepID=UPI00388E6E42